MFILPPPPKYYANGTTLQGLQTALEATNSLTQLDEEHSIVAPEGTYDALDCVYLAMPLPHPSDPPPLVINPLAPTTNLPSTHSSGVRLTCVNLPKVAGRSGSVSSGSMFGTPTGQASSLDSSLSGSFSSARSSQPSKGFGWTTSLFNGKNADNTNGDEMVSDTSDSGANPAAYRRDSLPSSLSSSIAYSIGSTISTTLSVTSSSTGKKSKPKSHLAKNNSSFVSRAIVHESINKRMQDRHPDDLFIWANVGRSISWLGASLSGSTTSVGFSSNSTKAPAGTNLNVTCKHEPLTKVLFTKSHPFSHDVNLVTRLPNSVDLVVGTSSGDILWIEPISNRYNRINKNGDVSRSAITDVKWIPGSENLFLAATADGLLIIFDKDREDAGFTVNGGMKEQDPRSTDTFKIIRSYHAGARQNPVAVYKVSNRPLTGIVFSPTGDTVAITSKDGYMRLLDLGTETLINIFPSYYAGFLCCDFSPDGLYLATGGQDDLVSIWSMKNKCLFARLQGHASWVRQVRWDQFCPNQYRLGSVGEDGNLLLWDFSPRTLTRPKIRRHRDQAKATPHHERSISELSNSSLTSDDRSLVPTDSSSSSSSESTNGIHHLPPPPKSKDDILIDFVPQNEIPILPPLVTKSVHVSGAEPDPLSDLMFLEKCIVISGKDGRIWTWLRPEIAVN